jgi:hypothetical protein
VDPYSPARWATNLGHSVIFLGLGLTHRSRTTETTRECLGTGSELYGARKKMGLLADTTPTCNRPTYCFAKAMSMILHMTVKL